MQAFYTATIFMWFLLHACATDSEKVVDNIGPPTGAKSVKVYTEEPKSYKPIGIVETFCDTSITEHECRDEAIATLRRQAAKLGANGITGITFAAVSKDSSVSAIFRGGILYSIPITKVSVSSTAAYVVEE